MKLEKLKTIREQAKKEMNLKQKGTGDKRIVVTMGTCGIAAGATEVKTAILHEITKRGISNLEVTKTGCAGHCSHEPLVTVIDEKESITYGKVTPEDARELIEKHILGGTPIGHRAFEPPH